MFRWLANLYYWLPDQLDGWIHGPEYWAMVLRQAEQNQWDELLKDHPLNKRAECYGWHYTDDLDKWLGEDDGKCTKTR